MSTKALCASIRYINVERNNMSVISWEEVFSKTALLFAQRSKDPSTQVGACIASVDNRILSVGYNGTPNGFDDDIFPWGKDSDDPLQNKYLYVVHAERNAILNFRGNNRELEGATIYVTHFPCCECAKEIVQSGIKHVRYIHPHGDSITNQATDTIFKMCHMDIQQVSAGTVQ